MTCLSCQNVCGSRSNFSAYNIFGSQAAVGCFHPCYRNVTLGSVDFMKMETKCPIQQSVRPMFDNSFLVDYIAFLLPIDCFLTTTHRHYGLGYIAGKWYLVSLGIQSVGPASLSFAVRSHSQPQTESNYLNRMKTEHIQPRFLYRIFWQRLWYYCTSHKMFLAEWTKPGKHHCCSISQSNNTSKAEKQAYIFIKSLQTTKPFAGKTGIQERIWTVYAPKRQQGAWPQILSWKFLLHFNFAHLKRLVQ